MLLTHQMVCNRCAIRGVQLTVTCTTSVVNAGIKSCGHLYSRTGLCDRISEQNFMRSRQHKCNIQAALQKTVLQLVNARQSWGVWGDSPYLESYLEFPTHAARLDSVRYDRTSVCEVRQATIRVFRWIFQVEARPSLNSEAEIPRHEGTGQRAWPTTQRGFTRRARFTASNLDEFDTGGARDVRGLSVRQVSLEVFAST